jgi:hypothetical protein
MAAAVERAAVARTGVAGAAVARAEAGCANPSRAPPRRNSRISGNEVRALHHRHMADPGQHDSAAVPERPRGAAGRRRVDQAVVAAVDEQGWRGDQGGVVPQRCGGRLCVLGHQRPGRRQQRRHRVVEGIAPPHLGDRLGPALRREPARVGVQLSDGRLGALLRRHGEHLGQQPRADSRHRDKRKASRQQPRPQVRQRG